MARKKEAVKVVMRVNAKKRRGRRRPKIRQINTIEGCEEQQMYAKKIWEIDTSGVNDISSQDKIVGNKARKRK